jgi:WD40 repeat protein
VEPRQFEGFSPNDVVNAVGFSPSGRLVAAASTYSQDQAMLRVWDLVTDEVRTFELPRDTDAAESVSYADDLVFVGEDTLYTAGGVGLLRWKLESGTPEMIRRAPGGAFLGMSAARDRRTALVAEYAGLTNIDRSAAYRVDLGTGGSESLRIPGRGFLQLSPDGSVWTSAEPDGSIWVGRFDADGPHLLLGHEGEVYAAVVSPDGRWIASSGGEDRTLRLWPMPDLSKPPLHTLPHEELIAKLKSLTNLRAVRDPESSTGWKIEVGPFPGWATVPEW